MVNQQFATALHIMSALGFNEGQLMQSSDLADSIRANPVVVRTLMQNLVAAGLVKTKRGKFGGVQVSRSPQKISLFDIYQALNPAPVICTRNTKGDKACPLGRCMEGIVENLANDLEKELGRFLKRKMLSDVLAEIK